MKPSILILSVLFTLLDCPAQETGSGDLEELLREALFEEEASQDLARAAEGYEKLLETYRSQRQFAATALFRLAEVRRKQERPKDAAKLYQQLLAEFPTHDPLARLSRENLLALGEELPSAETALGLLDEEGKEIERLRKIILDSPDLISAVEGGYAPIHRAAKNGHMRVLEFLLENGVNVDHETNKGTALSIAAQHGHLRICEYLIKCEADIELSSPLGEAIVSEYQNVVAILLGKGADPNGIHVIKDHWFRFGSKKRERRITMLGLAVLRGGHSFVKLLLEEGADLNLVGGEGEWTPLLWSMERHYEEIFALLLAQGADVNIGDDRFPTALHYAIGEPQGSDQKRRRMLRIAVAGNADLTGFARQLATRADQAVRDESGGTALIAAARAQAFDLLPLLIEAGAEVDARDNQGGTALFYALSAGKWDEAQKLIARGADPGIEIQGKPLIEQVPGSMRVHLMRLRYPDWNMQQAITLCLPQILYHTPLATGDGEPPNLASVLLDWQSPPSASQSNGEWVDWTHARIFRKAPKEIMDVTLSRLSPLPLLEWGDVIEFTTPNWQRIARHAHPMRNQSTRSWYYGGEVKNVLLFKRVLNISIVVDGETYDLALRGDQRVYDPRFPEAPLVPLNRLAKLLGIHQGAAVRVERRDEGGFLDVVVKDGGDGLVLEDGDRLLIARGDERLAERITLKSPGLLFGSSMPKEGPPPTLLQFLAAQYQAIPLRWFSYHVQQFGSNEAWLWDPEDFAKYEANRSDALPLAVLPFPDWSTLKIQRGEQVIEVNLQDAIDACQEATLLEQVRGWDRPLEWGDVVELGVRSADVPWTGFSGGTRRLFQKALQRQVVMRDAKGLVRSVDLQYVPSHYLNTFLGAIPVPSEVLGGGRVSVTRADALVESFSNGAESVGEVYRGDKQLNEYPARTWLQDGDLVIAIDSRTRAPSRRSRGSHGEGAASPPGSGRNPMNAPGPSSRQSSPPSPGTGAASSKTPGGRRVILPPGLPQK